MIKEVKTIGFLSSIGVTIFTLLFEFGALVNASGLLTGPNGLLLLVIPSFFLAFAFVIMMISLHYTAPDHKKFWSHLGCAFAVMYAVVVMIVYVTLMFVTIPNNIKGTGSSVSILNFNPGQFMYVLDGLGYTLMTLSTLFTSQIFIGNGRKKALRYIYFIDGLMSVSTFLVYMLSISWLIPINLCWLILMPVLSILTAVYFKKDVITD